MAARGKRTASKASAARREPAVGRKLGGVAGKARAKAGVKPERLTIWEKLVRWGGRGKGLPADLAERHDFYLHGRSDV